jgi:galactosamine-6-phosphate isomerase
MSQGAAASVMAALSAKRDSLLCLATGHSPAGLYGELVTGSRTRPDLFRRLRIVKLDEWSGVPAGDPASCEHYLRSRVLDPLGIDARRYLSFATEAADPLGECARVSSELGRHGPIDVCILGLGKNGHLGLNEPGPSLQPHCHVASLTDQTREHVMVGGRTLKPVEGLTLGMSDILQSRKIVLLIAGKGKDDAVARFLEGAVTTEVPATFLWLHADVEVWLDESRGRD